MSVERGYPVPMGGTPCGLCEQPARVAHVFRFYTVVTHVAPLLPPCTIAAAVVERQRRRAAGIGPTGYELETK